jgi:hypothetical protein
VPYRCPRLIDALTCHYALFFDVDPRHTGLASVHAHGRDHAMVFTTTERSLRVTSGRTLAQQLRAYLLLGVEHILHGYDHVAFVVGLLLAAGALPARRALREVATVVTSFTLAHSFTLALSVLNWVAMPPSVVEPIIALSIGFVAIENSIEGSVLPTLDSLAGGSALQVYAELTLDVAFSIVTRPGVQAGEIRTVAAFPVAAAQVRRWLAGHLPGAEVIPANSNAAAAREVADGRADAGVSTALAARRYGLDTLAEGIVDEPNARTRFVLVGCPGPPPPRTCATASASFSDASCGSQPSPLSTRRLVNDARLRAMSPPGVCMSPRTLMPRSLSSM